jgi:polysaccharide biosynthesis/export protein
MQRVRPPGGQTLPWRGVALLSATAVVAACTSTSNLPPAPPVPVETTSTVPLPPYRIQVGDVLEVKLLLNPELNEEVIVRPDGHISTTVIPDEQAVGRTPGELAGLLRRGYSRDLRNPRVSVVVKAFAPTRIYVGGEVVAPGEFINVGPALTLSQAIARAGGTKLSSDDASIFIIRRGANDAPQLLSTKYGAVKGAVDPVADVRLAPYDVVYVPKSGIAEVYKWYNQYIEQFAHPSFGFSYILNPVLGGGATTVITGQ